MAGIKIPYDDDMDAPATSTPAPTARRAPPPGAPAAFDPAASAPPMNAAEIKAELCNEETGLATLLHHPRMEDKVRVLAIILAATCDGIGITTKEAVTYSLVADGTPLYNSTNLRSRLSDLNRDGMGEKSGVLYWVNDSSGEGRSFHRWFVSPRHTAAVMDYIRRKCSALY